MKNHGIILAIIASLLLYGCAAGKAFMDNFSTDLWIIIYFVTSVVSVFIAVRYCNRFAFKFGVIVFIGFVGAIAYRLGYLN